MYSYLLGYSVNPEGVTENHYYPPTKMPDILGISTAPEAQRPEIQGTAHDIVSFLSWAADPHGDERIRLGYYVMAYLVVLDDVALFRQEKSLVEAEIIRTLIGLFDQITVKLAGI